MKTNTRVFPLLATQYYNFQAPIGSSLSYKIKKTDFGVRVTAYYQNKPIGVFPKYEAVRIAQMAFFGKGYELEIVVNKEACRVIDRPMIKLSPKASQKGIKALLHLFSVLAF